MVLCLGSKGALEALEVAGVGRWVHFRLGFGKHLICMKSILFSWPLTYLYFQVSYSHEVLRHVAQMQFFSLSMMSILVFIS